MEGLYSLYLSNQSFHALGNVWFQKIFIPHDAREDSGNSKGEGGGGVENRNFQGVEGFHGEPFFQRVKHMHKNFMK